MSKKPIAHAQFKGHGICMKCNHPFDCPASEYRGCPFVCDDCANKFWSELDEKFSVFTLTVKKKFVH